jgi:hypothetical protein
LGSRSTSGGRESRSPPTRRRVRALHDPRDVGECRVRETHERIEALRAARLRFENADVLEAVDLICNADHGDASVAFSMSCPLLCCARCSVTKRFSSSPVVLSAGQVWIFGLRTGAPNRCARDSASRTCRVMKSVLREAFRRWLFGGRLIAGLRCGLRLGIGAGLRLRLGLGRARADPRFFGSMPCARSRARRSFSNAFMTSFGSGMPPSCCASRPATTSRSARAPLVFFAR